MGGGSVEDVTFGRASVSADLPASAPVALAGGATSSSAASSAA